MSNQSICVDSTGLRLFHFVVLKERLWLLSGCRIHITHRRLVIHALNRIGSERLIAAGITDSSTSTETIVRILIATSRRGGISSRIPKLLAITFQLFIIL